MDRLPAIEWTSERVEQDDMELERQMRRLLLWNRFWLSLLIMTALAWGVHSFIAAETQDTYTLTERWDGQGLKLSALTDGPFVITHLVDRRTRSWAALPSPIAVVDSHGVYIPINDVKKLHWQDYLGQPCPFPATNARITALYYRSLTAHQYGERVHQLGPD
jgi:hypothetical protein